MTLGFGILTHEFCCLVSDRRTTGVGLPPNDEFDKMCGLNTLDAKIAMTFSGLAHAYRYHSKVKLIETLKECAEPDFLLMCMLRRMVAVMNKDFLQDPSIRKLSTRDRRFSLLIMGFRSYGGHIVPMMGMISNYQDMTSDETVDEAWPEFRPFITHLPDGLPAHGLMTGFSAAIDQDKARSLVISAASLRSRAVIPRMVHLVQEASLRSNVIGGQVSSIMIPKDFKQTSMLDYHVSSPQRSYYIPATVMALPPRVTWMQAGSIRAKDPNGPFLAVPVVNRNQLCPCRSGRRYKHCHRKHKRVAMLIR